MKKKIKKWLGLVLALALVVGSLPGAPLPAYAGSDAANTLDKDKFHQWVPYDTATKISFGTKSRKGSEAPVDLGDVSQAPTGGKIHAYRNSDWTEIWVVHEEDGTIVFPKDCTSLFSGEDDHNYKLLRHVFFYEVDTSQVKNMMRMFFKCSQLEELDLTAFNTGRVEDMRYMFYGCEYLNHLDLSTFDTRNADMTHMFSNCFTLSTIKVSSTFQANQMSAGRPIFENCYKLKGDQGTLYNPMHKDKSYARIDGVLDAPGYFTPGTATPPPPVGSQMTSPDMMLTLAAITEGDKTISGTGKPHTMITVTGQAGSLIGRATVDGEGKWSLALPEGLELTAGTLITAMSTSLVDRYTDSTEAEVQAKPVAPPELQPDNPPIPDEPSIPDKPSLDDLNTEDHYQYLIGYPDGSFAPDRSMTRAEVATMFTRLLKDRPVPGQHYYAGFNDIDSRVWYADTVGYAVEKGIVSGYPDGSFRPDQAITRAEFSSIASRFAQLTLEKNLFFTDLPPSHWGYKAVRLAASNGWIFGYPDNTFRPERAITRAEVTSITNRMLNRQADLNWMDAHPANVFYFTDVARQAWFYEPVMEAAMGHDFTRDADGTREHWTGVNEGTFI